MSNREDVIQDCIDYIDAITNMIPTSIIFDADEYRNDLEALNDDELQKLSDSLCVVREFFESVEYEDDDEDEQD